MDYDWGPGETTMKMKKISVIVGVLMSLFQGASYSQGVTNGTSLYYVGSGGSNSNSGKTWALRWADLSKVNSTLGSESNYDTVLVADGVYTDELNLSYSGSSASNILVVMNYGTDRPEIRRYSGYHQYGWNATSADSNQMLQGFLVSADAYINWYGAKRLILQDCYLLNRRDDDLYEQGKIYDYSSYCTVRRCTTFTDDQDPAWGDDSPSGDGVAPNPTFEHNGLTGWQSNHILVEDCHFLGTIRHYTQATGYASADNNYWIFRNNYVAYCHGESEASAGGAHHLLFENITYRKQYSSWASQNGKGSFWQTLGAYNIIFRFNTLAKDTNGYNVNRLMIGTGVQGTGVEDQTYNMAFYNNTIMGAPHASTGYTDRGYIIWCENYEQYSYALRNIHFKNNIFFRNNSQWMFWSDVGTTTIDGENNTFSNNIFYDAATYNKVQLAWRGGGTGSISLSSAESTYPDMFNNNIQQYPVFNDTSVSPYDFSLKNTSPAIDAGTYLTLVNDIGGGSGTSLVVDNAMYFCDGWGMVEGDSIKIGSQDPVGITAISGNTITLEASRTWADNDPVYYYRYDRFNGAAPDIGALEYSDEEGPETWAPFEKIWAVDGSQYVQWDTRTSPARGNDSNSVWRGDSVHIFGLKNDVASFQLILEAGTTGVDSINVVIDSLNHGTDVIKSASASCSTYVDRDIESFLESYVYIGIRDTTTTFYANALPGPDASYLGWIPEQLVPMEAPRKWVVHGTDTMQGGAASGGFKVFANKNAAVWFDIRIDKNKPSGTYAGSVKVKKVGGATLFTIPIELRVYNATLSDTNHFPVMTHYHHSEFASRAGVTEGTDYYWNTFTKRLHFFMHRHRMDLIISGERYDSLLARRMRYYSGWIFSNANGYQGPGEGVGQKMYVAALWNCNFTQYPSPGFDLSDYGSYESDSQTGWRDLTNDFEQAFLDSAAHVIRMVELIDEPYTDEQRNAIVTRSTWIRTGSGVGRKMHIMIPNGWMDDWFIESSPATGYSSPVSIWFQNPWAGPTEYHGYHTNRYWGEVNGPTVEYLRNLMRNDSVAGLVSTYNSLPGFTPEINSIDIPATYPRLWGWMGWEYNLPFYWAWTSTQWALGDANPWEDVFHYQGHDFDGNLFYYGRDMMYTDQDRGVNTPIASIRLKNLRDGIRDYEMLYLASQNSKLNTSWIDSVGMWAAFDDWQYWAHGETPKWATNGYTMEAIRLEIAIALESGEPTPTLKRLIGRKR
jgi:hypothetical protein